MKNTAVSWLMSLSSPGEGGAEEEQTGGGGLAWGLAWGLEQLGRQIKRNEMTERPLTMCRLPAAPGKQGWHQGKRRREQVLPPGCQAPGGGGGIYTWPWRFLFGLPGPDCDPLGSVTSLLKYTCADRS